MLLLVKNRNWCLNLGARLNNLYLRSQEASQNLSLREQESTATIVHCESSVAAAQWSSEHNADNTVYCTYDERSEQPYCVGHFPKGEMYGTHVAIRSCQLQLQLPRHKISTATPRAELKHFSCSWTCMQVLLLLIGVLCMGTTLLLFTREKIGRRQWIALTTLLL